MPGPGLSSVPLTVANGINVTKKGATAGVNVNTGTHVTVRPSKKIYNTFGGRRKTKKSKSRKARKTRR